MALACSAAIAPAHAGLMPCVSGSGVVGADLRERQAGDVRVIAGQIFRAERGVFLFVAVQRADRARIKCGQPAAREIIFHFRLHSLDGGGGGLGVQAERQHGRVAFGLFPPVGISGGLGKKLIHLGLADAGLAAGIRYPRRDS